VAVADAALLTAGKAGATMRLLIFASHVELPPSGTERPTAEPVAGYDSIRIKQINVDDASGAVGLDVRQGLVGIDGLFDSVVVSRVGNTNNFFVKPKAGIAHEVERAVVRACGCLDVALNPNRRKRGQYKYLPPKPCEQLDGLAWLLDNAAGLHEGDGVLCKGATCYAVSITEIERRESINMDATLHARPVDGVPMAEDGSLLEPQLAYVCASSQNPACPLSTASCSPNWADVKQMHGSEENKGHDKGIPALRPHMTAAQHPALLMASDAVHYTSKLDRMMGFESQLYLFGGCVTEPLSGLPAKADSELPYGFDSTDNTARLATLKNNMLQAMDEIMFQLLACNVEGRPDFFLNCPVTPSWHQQVHVSDLTLETPSMNAVTEEVGESRNGPGRGCSKQYAQGSQAGANRPIILCMERADRNAFDNSPEGLAKHTALMHEYAERSLRKHHKFGKELGGFLECTFNFRWPACFQGADYTFEWRPPRGSTPGQCLRVERHMRPRRRSKIKAAIVLLSSWACSGCLGPA